MDESLILILRMLERLLVVGFAGMAIYLGYKLFFHLPNQTNQEGKLDLPGLKVVLSRVGPGVFFLAFGSFVLVSNLDNGIETVVSSTVRDSEVPQQSTTRRFAGATDLQMNDNNVTQRRVAAIEHIGELNCLLKTLEASTVDISSSARIAMNDAKIALLRPVWSETYWGDIKALEINSDSIENEKLQGVFNNVSVSCRH